MWNWREFDPASPLYYSWGGTAKITTQKKEG